MYLVEIDFPPERFTEDEVKRYLEVLGRKGARTKVVSLSVPDLDAGPPPSPQSRARIQKMRQDAREAQRKRDPEGVDSWLRFFFFFFFFRAGGPVPYREVAAAAKEEAGISPKQLRTARPRVGVRTLRWGPGCGDQRERLWELPGD